MSTGVDSPPHSRIFVVCGKSAEADLLSHAFSAAGPIQNLRLIKDKGVAYIKYERASSAALAVETLHETVLNDGRGPTLKVMLAEAQNSRKGIRQSPEPEPRADPDNWPARSRLFLVVPKTADADSIQAVMSQEPDLQYCKTDLIGAKGIVFCKYARASSALHVMEAVNETGMLAGYKVKCMLAEPKSKRHSPEAVSWTNEAFSMDYGRRALSTGGFLRYPPPSPTASAHSLSGMSDSQAYPAGGLASSLTSSLGRNFSGANPPRRPPTALQQSPLMPGMHSGADSGLSMGCMPGQELQYPSMAGQAMQDYSGLQNLNGLTSLQAIAALQGAANLAQVRPVQPHTPSALDILSASKQAGLGGLGQYHQHQHPSAVAAAAAAAAALTVPPGAQTPQSMTPLTLGGSTPQHSLKLDFEPPTPTASTPSPQAWSPQSAAQSGLAGQQPPTTRLYVVVSKAVGAELLLSLFCTIPGLLSCDLKTDHRTGLSRGFCYVTYSTVEAAAAAMDHFNGMECPPNSGHSLKILWAQPQPMRTSSAGMHTGESMGIGVGAAAALQHHHNVEVAAVQNSLAHMSMPHVGVNIAGGTATPVQAKAPGRRQPPGSPESEGDSGSASGTTVPSPLPSGGAYDEHVVYTIMTRPMPSYALEHVFAAYGPVEWVRLQRDSCYGVVRFQNPGSATAAVDALNGTNICGQALSVLTTDPLSAARNKRPRMAE
ncbi:hypothetical protein WJX73_008634 [Symbiochloris irregularis]|uniref:RRM domain-containing protein n=1 Tax=Symbiochloris irregularis TaxID=706552 RepID=A0AAW1PQT9_9CHLO